MCSLPPPGHDRPAKTGLQDHARGLHGRHHGGAGQEEDQPLLLRLNTYRVGKIPVCYL